MIIPATAVKAANGEEAGMVINKTAVDNGNGTYTITLEAYATGELIITPVTHDVPTDIIIVLDQSGSMGDSFNTYQYNAYTASQSTNSQHYDRRNNGGSANLWHLLPDGSYVPVNVTRQNTVVYEVLPSNYRNIDYWGYRNVLYEKVGNDYMKVTLTRALNWQFRWEYTYEFSDGTTVVSTRDNTRPDLGVHAPLYRAVDEYIYTYTYLDSGGVTQNIGTSLGANTQFPITLYRRDTVQITRLQALKNAVSGFTDAVANKAAGEDGILGTEDDVNHRVAIVGFASQSGYGNNTELLSIAGTNSGSVGVAYNNITSQNLIDVLQDMDTAAGQTMIVNAINALAAEGATEIDLGMDMAQRILNANPIPAGEERNQIVIVFTDGSPTRTNGFQKAVANSAISISNNIKAGEVDVYSIGIFDGADASSAGTEPSGNLPGGSPSLPAACNWFMQNLSSNNGTPQDPSYYMAAGDAETLNNIFQQISEQLETGGSDTTLNEEAIIKDIIAPSFTLPAGTTADDITLESWACTGVDGEGNYTWSQNPDAMGATAVIGSTNPDHPTTTNNQLSITGFDFSGNYVGTVTEGEVTTYRGHKLVIKFNVIVRPGFLGGNAVQTNTSAGVYENAEATEPVLTFDYPTVDVAIPDVNITTPSGEKNVYLLQTIPATDLYQGLAVEFANGVSLNLDPDAVNWGLEPWQNEYVDISVVYTDAENNPIPPEGLQNLTEDTSYNVTVTVEPKNTGSIPGTGVTKTGNLNINVFKPEVTFKDITTYYGANYYTDIYLYDSIANVAWKHNGVSSTEVTMTGTAPNLYYQFTPESGKIVDDKINTKDDIKVDVIVRISTTDVTSHVTFLHNPCVPPCGWNEEVLDGSPAFLIHVNTCTLVINKTGGANNESYVFDVYKDGVKYSEVTIWGNGSETLYELPVGNYTIQEDIGWSWRYTANNGGTVTLTATSPNGSITCHNTPNTKIYWLNGFSEIVSNRLAH